MSLRRNKRLRAPKRTVKNTPKKELQHMLSGLELSIQGNKTQLRRRLSNFWSSPSQALSKTRKILLKTKKPITHSTPPTNTHHRQGRSHLHEMSLDIGVLQERIQLYHRIKYFLRTHQLDDRMVHQEGRFVCPEDFPPLTRWGKQLGMGSFGEIVEMWLPAKSVELPAILKKAILLSKDSREKQDVLKGPRSDPCRKDWWEILYLRLLRKLLIQKKVPNLPFLYGDYLCPSSTVHLKKKPTQHQSPSWMMLLEKAEGTFRDWVTRFPQATSLSWKSAFFQCLVGVYAYQQKYHMVNGDIKAINILYSQCKAGGYWCYRVDGKWYRVPNTGFVFFINDFGLAHCYHPKADFRRNTHDHHDLGHRLFRKELPVHDGVESGLPFLVLSPRAFPSYLHAIQVTHISGHRFFRWVRSGTTQEILPTPDMIVDPDHVSKPRTATSHRRVSLSATTMPLSFFDLNNTLPLEFSKDIRDVVFTFLGGKRQDQRGQHSQIKPPTDILHWLKQLPWNRTHHYQNLESSPHLVGRMSVDISYLLEVYFSSWVTPTNIGARETYG